MPITITRAHRDALYEELLTDLTGVGDIYLALSNRDSELAQRLWRRYEPELRLLDQLGWSPVEPIERFAIDLPREVLVRALAGLQERAEQIVGMHIAEPKDGVEVAQRAVHALAACRSAVAQLAIEHAGERS
jgi:hypothetical protein